MNANIFNPASKYTTPAIEALRSDIAEKLSSRFGDNFIESHCDYDFPVFTVKSAVVIDVLEFLYYETSTKFQFLTTMCGSHFPENVGAELGLMYQLHNLQSNERIRIKTTLPISDPKVRTATTIFATANWMERQEYDFFGIIFEGHPHLKRILNMDEMNYHPMRKEYALEEAKREDKDNTFFGR